MQPPAKGRDTVAQPGCCRALFLPHRYRLAAGGPYDNLLRHQLGSGQRAHFERLLSFVFEVDQSEHIAQYPANGEGIVELIPVERVLLKRSLALKFKVIAVVRNQVTGLFEEH